MQYKKKKILFAIEKTKKSGSQMCMISQAADLWKGLEYNHIDFLPQETSRRAFYHSSLKLLMLVWAADLQSDR